jgi:hypothetical protein
MTEQEIRQRLEEKQRGLAEINLEFGQAVTAGDSAKAEAAKARAVTIENEIADLKRLLESGALRRSDKQESARIAEEEHLKAFSEGEQFKKEHAAQLERILEQKAAYVQAIMDLAELNRKGAAAAGRVHQTRWMVPDAVRKAPMALHPAPLETFIRKLPVTEDDITRWYPAGNWIF